MKSSAFSEIGHDVPSSLHARLEARWSAYLEAAGAAGLAPPGHREWLRALGRVWAASDFVALSCIRDPALLAGLLDSGDLLTDSAPGEIHARVEAALAKVTDEAALGRMLRQLRRREMVRIAWRDLAGWASLEAVLQDLSDLADACIGAALDRLHAWQCRELGTPRDAAGRPQRLSVLGMGKLGAHELNFSSDIDLIFAYPEAGWIRRPRKLSHEAFFTRLGQRLIRVLADNTAGGFVYRVDMRLRPYGDSGPLVMDFEQIETYYQSQGREWERYALIKARPVAGDPQANAALMALLQPFVYRRYLDFGAFEQLREMKALIRREVARKGMDANIKLGPGGIREVEFIVQAFQLVRGGREPRLRERRLLRVLQVLVELDLLPDFAARRLAEAYDFLRRTENRLQEYEDAQTHQLPADEAGRTRLAFSMGYAGWPAFEQVLAYHRRFVDGQFAQVFGAPQAEAGTDGEAERLAALWRGALDGAEAEAVLEETGYDDPAEALRLLGRLRSDVGSRLGSRGRERLERLMPLLLAAVADSRSPARTLGRVARLIEAISGRSAYLALLVENPMALSQLVRLCDASPWIAEQLTRQPILLDELLDPRTLYRPPTREELERELARRFTGIGAGDLEQQMDALRHFKQAAVLRVAAADVAGAAPLTRVSDHLTDIAEVVLARVLELARAHLVERHGRPRCVAGGRARDAGFAIIGYGKLGGRELGYGSDLDLVFLHDSLGGRQRTEGPRPVDNALFFARLGQRIIHLLSTLTPAGVLYEVDMRLRPSGESGLLVTDIEAFARYQREEAWTWEHQALVRARPVAGDAAPAEVFEALRREVLGRPRDPGELQREVREMRRRMRAELDRAPPGRFDLKQGAGGIADIEFMVQYSILRWAHDHPDLLRFTDNLRLLEALAADGLLAGDEATALAEAYRAYRKRLHHLTLQAAPAQVEAREFAAMRQRVIAVWERLMGEKLEARS
ncbi:bifunctional [glutamate--ammonia ligase]-adenylyl-L-tyrosine phosphorylase/[glutamate--ammonia-ligase] adenylyltransferase [Thiohalobacter sp. IOR34]|uniref:bifunctional [glutamate--ammonia ligase]-adenylyl-L-tyrosine phosphorylase/[glutamate--ammonia-ligase] adenylyltransferase n=1 Tax=Thiohalobacter sp. IOR34 TaxID=3057176 RepID=UPI0025B1489A|nr:bifunctional [glutamate--ammonia ligase]-adenylyl-L-tyrosine phosphorylase/[glutamate--ammonia-ligase] adenylyltransferase [Thiohalobacter sp. IOR34]WJW75277.1 bifunctional [glutamate--ammonia ligase]-adenylyl-L-tyrosine phosphorylase/[glutamate--ammonia-ligase] adenylyltransferase [Thiohalobacter sp. IOR34]